MSITLLKKVVKISNLYSGLTFILLFDIIFNSNKKREREKNYSATCPPINIYYRLYFVLHQK